jgi:hypothetical protein
VVGGTVLVVVATVVVAMVVVVPSLDGVLLPQPAPKTAPIKAAQHAQVTMVCGRLDAFMLIPSLNANGATLTEGRSSVTNF